MTFKMTCLKCGTEYTGFRAICNTCMTTQAIEQQTEALRNISQGRPVTGSVDSVLTWVWTIAVWVFFVWLGIRAFG